MKIYDISQEVCGCEVYPGDKLPETELVKDMKKGDRYNLTNIAMGAHNGTHIDAPRHFIEDGDTVDAIPLTKFTGPCIVICHDGDFNEIHAKTLLRENRGEAVKRILIRGDATITASAAKVFADNNIYLIGNEAQTVGPRQAPLEVHKILLGKEVVVLEGIRLSDVEPGEYFLCAAPLNIAGSDGAPCRAILIKF